MANPLENTDAIMRFAAAKEREIVADLADVLSSLVDDPAVIRDIKAAMARNDLAGALRAVPLDKLPKALKSTIAGHIWDTFEKAADLAPLPKAVAASMRFDVTNPRAVEYISTMTMNAALQIQQDAVEGVRAIIRRAFVEGMHPYEAAREIKTLIGLTPNQVKTIANYSKFLDSMGDRETLVNIGQGAMDRLKRAGVRGVGSLSLTPEKKQELLGKYTARLIKERAIGIARTLTIEASNAGQNELWRQAEDDGLIDSRLWQKVWIAAHDERTCPLCGALHGQGRELSGTYPDGTGMPPRHPNCRCSEGPVKRSDAKELLPFHAQVAAKVAKRIEKPMRVLG
ncbi:MAG: phage minor head protein [Acidobacteriota bacterium]